MIIALDCKNNKEIKSGLLSVILAIILTNWLDETIIGAILYATLLNSLIFTLSTSLFC